MQAAGVVQVEQRARLAARRGGGPWVIEQAPQEATAQGDWSTGRPRLATLSLLAQVAAQGSAKARAGVRQARGRSART